MSRSAPSPASPTSAPVRGHTAGALLLRVAMARAGLRVLYLIDSLGMGGAELVLHETCRRLSSNRSRFALRSCRRKPAIRCARRSRRSASRCRTSASRRSASPAPTGRCAARWPGPPPTSCTRTWSSPRSRHSGGAARWRPLCGDPAHHRESRPWFARLAAFRGAVARAPALVHPRDRRFRARPDPLPRRGPLASPNHDHGVQRRRSSPLRPETARDAA